MCGFSQLASPRGSCEVDHLLKAKVNMHNSVQYVDTTPPTVNTVSSVDNGGLEIVWTKKVHKTSNFLQRIFRFHPHKSSILEVLGFILFLKG